MDSQGNLWRPGLEAVVRTGNDTDVVARAWWRDPWPTPIEGTLDPCLYRHAVCGKEFTVHLTVGPGTYYVKLKFAENGSDGPRQRAMTININGQPVAKGFDVFGTAGARARAVDLVFNDIQPRNGVISVQLIGDKIGEQQSDAFLNALEVGPGDGGKGASPKTIYAAP